LNRVSLFLTLMPNKPNLVLAFPFWPDGVVLLSMLSLVPELPQGGSGWTPPPALSRSPVITVRMSGIGFAAATRNEIHGLVH
jgi:hypothetical protein